MKTSGATYVDLDDSRVAHVDRASCNLTIELHQLRGAASKRLLIKATGVTKECAEYYIGHNITAPHPDSVLPLDFVDYAERGPDYLEFGGRLKGESWFVWRITARQIEIISSPSDQFVT